MKSVTYDQNADELCDIPGYTDYAITRDGRVWSKPKRCSPMGRWLKKRLTARGHLYVNLTRGGKPHSKYVHRLVLETYVGTCPEGMECRHLNGDPTDNRVENLAWGTHKENMHDRDRHGTTSRGEAHGTMSKLTPQQVRRIVDMYRTGLLSQEEIGDHYGVTQCTISGIVNRKAWRHLWAA